MSDLRGGHGDVVRCRASVEGHVQGVWFRASAEDQAVLWGVAGHARNLADGRVELVLEARREGVEAVLAWAQHGPPGARVDAVRIVDEEPAGERGFRVR
ncbi:MAG: acylphosphatase [Acidimicrobiia bacterium]